MPESEEIHPAPIHLEWSDWYPWQSLESDARTSDAAAIPPRKPGVYEVRDTASNETLTIGKASDLRMRVQQALVRGQAPHSAGERIRKDYRDRSDLVVRWAITDRPAAAEEALHTRHKERFGRLPIYVHHT